MDLLSGLRCPENEFFKEISLHSRTIAQTRNACLKIEKSERNLFVMSHLIDFEAQYPIFVSETIQNNSA